MTTQTASKPHYLILDGLRGVAALVVLFYHIFEAIAFAPINSTTPEQNLYHGFIAVDFFFILSGFVMGYAYDDRWNQMSLGNFIKRRIIRLHPMVIMGVVIGLICFCIQGCQQWDGTRVALSALMICTLLQLFCLPTPTSLDVRGNTEAFPLNGPTWSLFVEYIGSFCYGLFLHRLSTRTLKIWVVTAAILLLGYSLYMNENTIGYGWSSEPINLLGGLLRVSLGYPMGLLLARLFRNRKTTTVRKHMFLACSIALLLIFLVPGLGAASVYYQLFCLCVAFPLIVWYGATGEVKAQHRPFLSYLGRLSYPLYAVHYPLIYLYIYWIKQVDPSGLQAWIAPIVVILAAIALGTLSMLYYDEPVRKWLTRKLLK